MSTSKVASPLPSVSISISSELPSGLVISTVIECPENALPPKSTHTENVVGPDAWTSRSSASQSVPTLHMTTWLAHAGEAANNVTVKSTSAGTQRRAVLLSPVKCPPVPVPHGHGNHQHPLVLASGCAISEAVDSDR